jgi:hypothetical protein
LFAPFFEPISGGFEFAHDVFGTVHRIRGIIPIVTGNIHKSIKLHPIILKPENTRFWEIISNTDMNRGMIRA